MKKYLKSWGNKNKGDEKKLKSELHEEVLAIENVEEDGMFSGEQMIRKTEIQKFFMEMME